RSSLVRATAGIVSRKNSPSSPIHTHSTLSSSTATTVIARFPDFRYTTSPGSNAIVTSFMVARRTTIGANDDDGLIVVGPYPQAPWPQASCPRGVRRGSHMSSRLPRVASEPLVRAAYHRLRVLILLVLFEIAAESQAFDPGFAVALDHGARRNRAAGRE